MSNSNNSDFKRLAAEADNEREKEMKTRKEAQLLKLEVDRHNNEDDGNDKHSNPTNWTSNVSDATLSSQFSSRTSSVEVGAVDARIRTLEEQNRECKLAYVQLDEEKEMLNYQLCLIRDQIDDLNESYKNVQKELSERKKENAYQKLVVSDLNNRLNNLKHEVEIRDKLIVDNNLLMLSDSDLSSNPQSNKSQVKESNLDENSNSSEKNISGAVLLSKELVEQLKDLEENSLECCIRALFDERMKYMEEIKVLKRKIAEDGSEGDSVSRKDGRKKQNGEDFEALKQNYQNVKAQTQEYKRQLQISQQKITSLEADVKSYENKVIRLDGQVKRHKSIAEGCEKQEEELKQSKRKYQKEVREAQSKIEDLKSENASLTKKLEKLMKQKSKKDSD